MSEQPKHTPGPWVPEFGESYRVRAKQDGGQVAIMMNLKGQHGLISRRTGAEVAANARLIAAAPDLLEALKTCVAFIEDAHIIEAQWGWEPVKAAKAAIAKAEGRGE
jgi:hypothetical protein